MHIETVSFYGWAESRFLFEGDCFENCLLTRLEDGFDEYAKGKYYGIIKAEIDKNKGVRHPQDVLHDLFFNNLYLDVDFAKELRLFDVINIGCFSYKNEIGLSMITLLDEDMSFVLYERRFSQKNKLHLEFKICHHDYFSELYSGLLGSTSPD